VPLHNIIFDFDGTLVDSLKDVLDSLKNAFNRCGITVRAFDTGKIMQFQLKEAIRAIAPAITPEQTEQVAGMFRKIYDTIDYPNTRLMPSVAELLPKLKEGSVGMYIVSNKRAVPTARLLDIFNIRHFFSDVFNPDVYEGTEPMTKNDLLAHALQKHSLAKNTTAYVGDSEVDVIAAKENGVLAIAVQNGYGDIPSFKLKPDRSVRQIIEILSV
jgi:phosphoglycolate phosphatase